MWELVERLGSDTTDEEFWIPPPEPILVSAAKAFGIFGNKM